VKGEGNGYTVRLLTFGGVHGEEEEACEVEFKNCTVPIGTGRVGIEMLAWRKAGEVEGRST